jgi:hypothetical protein
VQVVSFFDWNELAIRSAYESVVNTLPSRFDRLLVGVLTLDERVTSSSNIEQLVEKFETVSGSASASLEVYSGCIDNTDPEKGWDAYFCYSRRLIGKRDIMLAINGPIIAEDVVVEIFKEICMIGDPYYGFSLDWERSGDGRHFAKGLSTEESSDRERESDSRWFNERINMKGFERRHNRHKSGHFKGIFKCNLINQCHLKKLEKISNYLGDIEELGHGRYLWIPAAKNFSRIKGHLLERDLLI